MTRPWQIGDKVEITYTGSSRKYLGKIGTITELQGNNRGAYVKIDTGERINFGSDSSLRLIGEKEILLLNLPLK